MGGHRISCIKVYKGNKKQLSGFEIVEVHIEIRSLTIVSLSLKDSHRKGQISLANKAAAWTKLFGLQYKAVNMVIFVKKI